MTLLDFSVNRRWISPPWLQISDIYFECDGRYWIRVHLWMTPQPSECSGQVDLKIWGDYDKSGHTPTHALRLRCFTVCETLGLDLCCLRWRCGPPSERAHMPTRSFATNRVCPDPETNGEVSMCVNKCFECSGRVKKHQIRTSPYIPYR